MQVHQKQVQTATAQNHPVPHKNEKTQVEEIVSHFGHIRFLTLHVYGYT